MHNAAIAPVLEKSDLGLHMGTFKPLKEGCARHFKKAILSFCLIFGHQYGTENFRNNI